MYLCLQLMQVYLARQHLRQNSGCFRPYDIFCFLRGLTGTQICIRPLLLQADRRLAVYAAKLMVMIRTVE